MGISVSTWNAPLSSCFHSAYVAIIREGSKYICRSKFCLEGLLIQSQQWRILFIRSLSYPASVCGIIYELVWSFSWTEHNRNWTTKHFYFSRKHTTDSFESIAIRRTRIIYKHIFTTFIMKTVLCVVHPHIPYVIWLHLHWNHQIK
jgi:hypothetical protein